MENNNKFYVLPNIEHGKPLHIANGNVDIRNDTPNNKKGFHGTTQVLFQKKTYHKTQNIVIDWRVAPKLL